jgi:hypothetical protein
MMAKVNSILIPFIVLLNVVSFNHYVYGQDDFEAWLKKDNEKLNRFIEEDDKKFVEFLKKEWTKIGLEREVPVYQKPKPISVPVYESDILNQTISPENEGYNVLTENEEGNINEERSKPPVDEPPENVITDEVSDQPPSNLASLLDIDLEANNLNSELDYYGSSISYYYNGKLRVGIEEELNRDKIAAYWNNLSASDYKATLLQAQYYKDQMNLNDWGYCELLFNYSKAVQNSSIDESYLFTWFMLVKSGYLVRIRYEGERVALLIATDNKMYGLPYFFPEGSKQTFYSISLEKNVKPLTGNLFIYKDDYPNLKKIIDLSITEIPTISSSFANRVLEFNIAGVDYTIPISYDKNVIAFFEYYPQTDLGVYFAAPMSNGASGSLFAELNLLIKDKNEVDAANFLLHFVQYATGYKIDEEQFKREKPFFPEESLHYNYSDCEDRAVLFSYLVTNLLGLEVIGIDYPNHIATAVNFNEIVTGTYYEHNGKRYTICDPTYLGAGVGVCMPKYTNVKADIIKI